MGFKTHKTFGQLDYYIYCSLCLCAEREFGLFWSIERYFDPYGYV